MPLTGDGNNVDDDGCLVVDDGVGVGEVDGAPLVLLSTERVVEGLLDGWER